MFNWEKLYGRIDMLVGAMTRIAEALEGRGKSEQERHGPLLHVIRVFALKIPELELMQARQELEQALARSTKDKDVLQFKAALDLVQSIERNRIV